MSTFNPTPAEIALTSNIFNLADPQKLGILTGDAAVKVLLGTNLSGSVLCDVWDVADEEDNGFLTRKGVAMALRLIGHAQRGESVREDLLNKPGPLAHIDGVATPATAGPGSPAPPSPPKSSPSRQAPVFPPLTQQDKAKFLKLFIGCGPVNGLLSGEKARDIFVKSKLPYEKLSQIWTLADTRSRGVLDSTDFIIGMYLIQASMSSSIPTLLPKLPTWIYDQAAQRDANAMVASPTTEGPGNTGLESLMQNPFQIPRLFHVEAQLQQWDLLTEAKFTSDKFFDALDTQRRGYIEGDTAVPFMMASELPRDDLARIWDLADLHKDGRLTRDGFAVAMHLLNAKLAGTDIPATLPPSLMPPSTGQSQSFTSTETTGETLLNFLGHNTPPHSVVPLQPTGGSSVSSAANASLFGYITQQEAFQHAFSLSRQPSTFSPTVNMDSLGDEDNGLFKTDAVPDKSTGIGNDQNQISSTHPLFTIPTRHTSEKKFVIHQDSRFSRLQVPWSAANPFYEADSNPSNDIFSRNGNLCLDGHLYNFSTHPVDSSGGFADVWEGYLSHQKVAIKVIRRFAGSGGIIPQKKLIRRLWREYLTWSRLSHPNVLKCLGFSYAFSTDSHNLPALVSPWMSNGNVLRYIQDHPNPNRFALVYGIAQGLDYLHTRRPAIVHGDLRAGNVLVSASGEPCLSDFGLARVTSDIRGMTTSSEVAGSLRWMSPELLKENNHASMESDVWAFGMTTLEILSGERPYSEIKNDAAVLGKILTGTIPARPQEISFLSDISWEICKDCWSLDYSMRPNMRKIKYKLRTRLRTTL